MLIGGLQKFTMLDYPEHLAAIIFTAGCNFRCHFCYNPMLVWPEMVGRVKYSSEQEEEKDQTLIKEDDLFRFLKERADKLEGVVITGGEPTLHADLPVFIKKIKDFGYLVKLDTNGTNPEMLTALTAGCSPLVLRERGGSNAPRRGESSVDYIAMDLKAPREKYEQVVGVKTDFSNIEKSVKIIMESGLPYEFRTTIVLGLHEKADIEKTGELIRGADKWYLQKFKSDVDLVDLNYKGGSSFTDKDMKEMVEIGKKFVKFCAWR
jgi:pyruvate formate lyase activating enzyme